MNAADERSPYRDDQGPPAVPSTARHMERARREADAITRREYERLARAEHGREPYDSDQRRALAERAVAATREARTRIFDAGKTRAGEKIAKAEAKRRRKAARRAQASP